MLAKGFYTDHYKGNWPFTYSNWNSTKYLIKCMKDINAFSRHQYSFQTEVSLKDMGIPLDTQYLCQEACPLILPLSSFAKQMCEVIWGSLKPTYNINLLCN